MNKKMVVGKTAKGLREASGKTNHLARDARKLLKECDGKATLGDLLARLKDWSAEEMDEAVTLLINEDYLRDVTPESADMPPPVHPLAAAPIASIASGGTEELDFTAIEAPSAPLVDTAVEAQRKQEIEARSRQEAEERRRQLAERLAKQGAEEKARRDAAEKVRLEAEELSRLEVLERVRKETEERVGKETEARVRKETEERVRQETEARVSKETEARVRKETEDRVRRETEERFRMEAEERARKEAEDRARTEADERARREAGERARREAEERMQRDAEDAARREMEAEARRQAAERASTEAAERARREAEERTRREVEERTQREAEAAARREAEAEAQRQAEERAKKEEADRIRREAEEKAQREAEERAERAAAELARKQAEEELEEAEARRDMEDRRKKLEADAAAREAAEARTAAATASSAPRKPLKLGPIVAVLVVLLLVGVLGGLPFVAFDGRKAQIEKLATAQFKQPVKIGAVHVALLPQPHVRLDSVSIGEQGQIRVPQIRLLTSPAKVLGDSSQFDSAQLDAPVVSQEGLAWLVMGKAGSGDLKLGRLRATNLKLESPGLALPALAASIDFGDDGNWRGMTIDGAEGKIKLDLQAAADAPLFELRLESLPALLAAAPAVDGITATGVITRDGLDIREYRARAAGGELRGKARLKWAPGLLLEGDLKASEIDAAKLLPGVMEGGQLQGRARFGLPLQSGETVTVAANLDGDFVVDKGALAGVDLGRMLQSGAGGGQTQFTRLVGNATLQGGKVQLRQMRLDAGKLSATGTADVDESRLIRGQFAVELSLGGERRRANVAIAGPFKPPYKSIEWSRR